MRTLFILFMPVLCAAGLSAAELDFKVFKNTVEIGKIVIDTALSNGNQGITDTTSWFEVTKEKQGGGVMTIPELEAFLGRGHFNWWQMVVGVNPHTPHPDIDPPKGGFGTQWADDLPWYFDESAPPNPNDVDWSDSFLLSNNVSGSKLKYFDFPGGQPVGTQVDFVTFLIQDLGGRKFQVIDGFKWGMKILENGKTDILESLFGSGIPWKNEYTQQIKTEFGDNWTLVPEPTTFILVIGLALLHRRR